MLKDDYVNSIVVGDKLINIGLDDYGQCYFIEWAENGESKQESCGSYNTDYKSYIEYKFGEPEKDCPFYDSIYLITEETKNCSNRDKFGYCDKCKYKDREWSNFQELIKMGIIDRRGNVNKKYTKYLQKKEIDDKSN